MAVIQPYFDPTPVRSTGVFASFLAGFMEERSSMNKMIMKQMLSMLDPAKLREQQQIIMRNIGELQKRKAMIQAEAMRGQSRELVSMYKALGSMNAQRIAGQAKIGVAQIGAEKDILETLLKIQSDDKEMLRKAKLGTRSTSDQKIAQVDILETKKTDRDRYDALKDYYRDQFKIPDDPQGDAVINIKILKDMEDLGKVKAYSKEKTKRQIFGVKQLARSESGLDARATAAEAEAKFKKDYNLGASTDDLKSQAQEYTRGGGVGGATAERLMLKRIQMLQQGQPSGGPEVDVSDIDKALKRQWKEYKKMGTKIDEMMEKGASGVFDPFQYNYMLENLNTREHRNQMLADSLQVRPVQDTITTDAGRTEDVQIDADSLEFQQPQDLSFGDALTNLETNPDINLPANLALNMAFIPEVENQDKPVFDASAVNDRILKTPVEKYKRKKYFVSQNDPTGRDALSNYSTELITLRQMQGSNDLLKNENFMLSEFPHVYAAQMASEKTGMGSDEFFQKEFKAVDEAINADATLRDKVQGNPFFKTINIDLSLPDE